MSFYSISDFLIDKKKEIKRLERLYRKSNSQNKPEIREQIEYAYRTGLYACNRFRREIPDCVRKYFLGYRKRPAQDEITSEIQEINWSRNYQLIQRIVRITTIVIVTILTILAFASY